MFSTHPKENFSVLATYILSSANALILKQSEILSFGKGVRVSESKMSSAAVYFRSDMSEESSSDILISGMSCRNRAIQGDIVVVELLPKSQWQGKSGSIHDPAQGEMFGVSSLFNPLPHNAAFWRTKDI